YSFAKYLADDRQTVIDQRKRDELDNKTFTTSINYTEPLGQLWTATFGYAFQTNNASTLNQSFNKDPNTGVYSVLDEAVLNDFDFKSIKSSANTGLNFKNEKWTINTSANVDFEDVKRYYKNINNTLKRSQHAVNPRASIGYNLAKNKILTFLYRGRTIQPDLAQIEPLKQNADQLVNYLDNPNLSAGFDNRYIMRFNSFRPLKERSFFLAGSVTQQIKSIAAKVRYYPGTGKRDISYVNMDKQNWSFNLIGNYQMPILRKIGLNMSMGTEATYSTRYSYLSTEKVESELNKTEQVSIRGNLGFSRYKANQLDLSLSLNPGMSVLNSSLQKELNSKVFEFSSDAYIVYYLPIDFELSFNINQSYSGATKTLPSYHIFNVNGYLSKKLLRSKALETQIYVNDLLNKNNGIERSQNGSSFIQTRNDVVRRYIMLKLIYNFTTIKNGG
ncbi:MAG: outer membrane beta-barrel family protein, partial [Sphingobacterium sp.]|nr:outer membrane beta-barrel family protein [Sphingobacterium sp.]